MTREEQLQCIAENCEAFKKALLAKALKIPPNWDSMEIRQWVMECAKDAWGVQDGQNADAPVPAGEATLRPVNSQPIWLKKVARPRDKDLYDVLTGMDARAMTYLCPTCARLGIEWAKAIEKRDALDDSIADMALREAAYVEAHRAFMAYVLRQRKCTECVRSESWN